MYCLHIIIENEMIGFMLCMDFMVMTILRMSRYAINKCSSIKCMYNVQVIMLVLISTCVQATFIAHGPAFRKGYICGWGFCQHRDIQPYVWWVGSASVHTLLVIYTYTCEEESLLPEVPLNDCRNPSIVHVYAGLLGIDPLPMQLHVHIKTCLS